MNAAGPESAPDANRDPNFQSRRLSEKHSVDLDPDHPPRANRVANGDNGTVDDRQPAIR
jgi:hypothetical protein